MKQDNKYTEPKLEILNDHYKDTFSYIRDYIRIRDSLLLMILIVVTVMLSQIFSPNETKSAISEFINAKLNLTTRIEVSFIGSVIWFGLFALIMKYFQTVVYIERQYNYIHKLEDVISKEFNGEAFTREGKSHLKDYPIFSEWSQIVYRIIFPAILTLVSLIKIIGEWVGRDRVSWLLIFYSLVCGCILISIIFYLLVVHTFKKEAK